jgi:hypothetical protein
LPLPQYLVEPPNKSRQEEVAVRNLPFSALTFLTPNQYYDAERYAAEPLSEKGIIRQNSSSAQAAG